MASQQRNRTSKNILTVNLAWEDLEEHLEYSKKTFEEAIVEFQVREDDLNSISKSLAERIEEVELLRKELESRCEEQDLREAEFYLLQEEKIEYLRAREEQMESRYADIKRLVEERIDDADLKEERLESNVSLKLFELDFVQEAMGSRSRELDEKQVIHESRFTDLETIQFQIDKQLEDLHDEEQQRELRSNALLEREKNAEDLMVKYRKLAKKLDVIQKLNEEKEKALELKDKELDYKRRNIDSIQVSFDQSLKEFHLKEKQFKLDKEELDLHIKEVELKREKLAEKSKEIEQTRESLEQKAKGVEEERKHLREQRRDIKLEVNEMPPINGSAADINLTLTMDGKNLQLFLNENVNHQDSMHTEIIKVLGMSRDPATVVLDAMKGFYPPHLTVRDKMFETSVVMKTCILLLQQLRRISPRIELKVGERALKLAEEWMNKISHTTHDSLAALGLLHLLASYDLASSFDLNDILRLLELVAHDNEVYELCGVPCFADMIPDFVKRLIESTKYLVAVRFICKLNLVDKFPPVPLLTNHINLWKKIADRDKALEVRMTSIEEVIKCTVEFDLQSSFPLSGLKRSLEKLSKQKRSGNNEIRKQDDANVIVDDNIVECDPLVDTQMSVVTSILANMDGKCLLLFLSEHLKELDLLQKDVSKALKMSSDSGRIMIIAIMEDFHGHKIPSCSMVTYLFVLQILAGNIPIEIIKSPVVVEAAMKVAVKWKANLPCRKDPIYILRFLQLVCTYKLTSEFDQAELYNLCCSLADESGEIVPELSEIISLSEQFPVSKILNVDQKNTNQSVIPTRAPWNSLPHGTVPDLFRLSVDPARLLLNAMRFLFLSIDLKSDGSCTMEIFIPLLKELVNVTVDIDIHSIKSEALSFVVDWKEKLRFRKSGEAFCFLLFLSIYKLGSCFDDEEVIHLLNSCKNDFSGSLLRHFGLEEKMIEFIQKLPAQKDRLSKAISLIFDFQLVDMFSPVSLLKNYLACAEEASRKRCHQTTREKAVETEIDALQTVLRCIKFHKLKSMFPPGPLYKRLKELKPVKAAAKKRHAHLPPDSEREARRAKKVRNGIPSAPASSSASMGYVPTTSSYKMPQASYLPPNNTESSSSMRRRYGAGRRRR